MGRLICHIVRSSALKESLVEWDLVFSEVSVRALRVGAGESVQKKGIFSSLENSQSQGVTVGEEDVGSGRKRVLLAGCTAGTDAWGGWESHAVCLAGTGLLDGLETPDSTPSPLPRQQVL